jgi:hypothetical protein
LASIDDRSFDPDQEPKKEGFLKMKHSPSVVEIQNDAGQLSDGASIGNINERVRKGSLKSPGRLV